MAEGGVECLHWQPVEAGALRGFFDCRIIAWGLVLRDCKLYRKNGREWVGLPTERRVAADGEVTYKKLVVFEDRARDDRFQAAALAALKPFVQAE